ncbi:hypothetical protein D1815_07915 [Aquimarina sp. AD1]|uniref:SH3 domain-containing protein n=2 Tax=Aquimarina sp. (strain AD1) TaxID=1714848 RepID=UPI000E551328|nr:SH3 domain-containing protein [Aquimarina sp. AD1]AXT55681.1 hypothetical protein D1815_07915 [Aquimarina sp. AD1]
MKSLQIFILLISIVTVTLSFGQEKFNYKFLNDYSTKEVPLEEKTKLDHNAPTNHITVIQKKALHFDKITEDWKQVDCGVLYNLKLSENYITWVLYYYWGEELHTTLVNYDLEYNFIDSEQLAMDENAEGWTLSESTITRHRIHRMDALYIEPEQIEYINFIFKDTGEIVSEKEYYNGDIPDTCIHYFDPLAVKYVQALNGLNIRDENGNKIGKLLYGEKVNIIKYTNKELSVNDNGKIINGSIVEICNYESGYNKRRYVFDGYLVDDTALKLYNTQLCPNMLTEDDKDPFNNGERVCLDDIYSIILEKLPNSIPTNFITKNDNVIIEKGEITLPLTNGKKKTFVNNTKYLESTESYEYIGFLESFNYHLIAGSYFEEGDFFFVDQNNGEIKTRFPNYPHISPDKKTIICFYFNPYNHRSEFFIYTIDNKNQITLKRIIEIVYWGQNMENTEILWTSNLSFLVKATPIATMWESSGNYNKSYQNIHIKIHK